MFRWISESEFVIFMKVEITEAPRLFLVSFVKNNMGHDDPSHPNSPDLLM